MEEKIQIIKADTSHLQEVFGIVRKSSDWMKEKYGFTHWDEYYTLDVIKENFAKGTVYLLFDANHPVATYTVKDKYPSYYPKEDLKKFSDIEASSYYPTTLCVHPDHHGRGYAKMILKHIEEVAREKGVKYIRFDARGVYTELIEFYKKMEYRVVGEMLDEGELYYLFEKEVV